MPVNSRDVQFGAAVGFIVIVGIVAIYFGFSTKLILALLAGLGILFCASLVEGYVRAAMLGTGALLLVLIAYDLATSCDSSCQQTRAQAAQQRTAQEQARLAAENPPDPQCSGVWETKEIGPNPVIINPGGSCIWRAKTHVCFYGKRSAWTNDATEYGPYCDKGENTFTETVRDLETVRTADGSPAKILVLLISDPEKTALRRTGVK
jgi:hypothetical protein